MIREFENFTHIKLEDIADFAEKNQRLKPREISFLRSMAGHSRRGEKLSPKQRDYFNVIMDKYDNNAHSAERETVSHSRPRHMSIRLAWHDNKWNGKMMKRYPFIAIKMLYQKVS